MFRKIEKNVSMFTEYVSMTLIVIMTLVVCFTVFTRYFLSYTPSWGEEAALFCMVWFGFLSTALGVRDDGHIGVTVLDPLFSSRALWFLDFFKWGCVFAFGCFMVKEGVTLTEIGRYNTFPGLHISSAWLYLVVPAAGSAIMVYCLEKFVDLLKRPRYSEEKGGDK